MASSNPEYKAKYIVDYTKNDGGILTMVYGSFDEAKRWASSTVTLKMAKVAKVYNKQNQDRCLRKYTA